MVLPRVLFFSPPTVFFVRIVNRRSFGSLFHSSLHARYTRRQAKMAKHVRADSITKFKGHVKVLLIVRAHGTRSAIRIYELLGGCFNLQRSDLLSARGFSDWRFFWNFVKLVVSGGRIGDDQRADLLGGFELVKDNKVYGNGYLVTFVSPLKNDSLSLSLPLICLLA